MTGYSPLKKLILSIFCAFLLIIYVPVACIVGNDLVDEDGLAQAQTNSQTVCEEETSDGVFADSNEI